MTPQKIKEKVLGYRDWEWWAERPFGAFIMSLFESGQNIKYMAKAGVQVQWPATLFQKGVFYKSQKAWDKFAHDLTPHLKGGKIVFKITKSCKQYHKNSKREVLGLLKSKQPVLIRLNKLYEILTLDISYVWLTHGLEHIYKQKLYEEVPKYIKTVSLEKYIGDISYPSKKVAHNYLEDALRSGLSVSRIQKRFAWIKVRDGFSNGFSIAELTGARKQIGQPKRFERPFIPKPLRQLARIAQELVYLRTLRTDILYELMWLSRPILKEVGALYGIPFKGLKDYTIQDLLAGKPKKYSAQLSWISYKTHTAIFNKPILKEKYFKRSKLNLEIKGVIANRGIVSGRAKIVRTAHEIDKVKKGDILFAPTTAPSYIIGMKRALAFVTDEGGITSHAAIVSREMQKPCIIGTKIATKVFKDGDLVEVDANRSIVRKLE